MNMANRTALRFVGTALAMFVASGMQEFESLVETYKKARV